jgi:pre-mRNA-splicing factor CWC22
MSLFSENQAYIPPFKLARILEDAKKKDISSVEYQRLSWEALKKSINGLVNRVNASNVKNVLAELFAENLIRGQGLLCRSLMKSQVASPPFTPVYAAVIAVINTKFPQIGELLLHRVVTACIKSLGRLRDNKDVCLACLTFIAHLVNQKVAHEVLAFELILLLLEEPTNDTVELATHFVKECGATLQDESSSGVTFVFDRLRAILHDGGSLDTRAQYLIEGLFAIRKAGFADSGYPSMSKDLDLVDEGEQITHELTLDDEMDAKMELDEFREDDDFVEHEEAYARMRHEILGSDSDDDSEEDGDDSEEDHVDLDREGEDAHGPPIQEDQQRPTIINDETGTDLVNLRRTIYLTIMSALDFEEAGHKLLKIGIPRGQEGELATMIIECCSQEKTFIKYYALLGERFCKLKREYSDSFADCFVSQYTTVHRLETNKLRNVAKLFAHLLATDALPWAILGIIRLNEEDTTSSSRIFVKILFQELVEIMGLRELDQRLQDPTCEEWFSGIFPKDSAKNMRFSINFFTSIGLGGLTDAMREYLKNLPKVLEEAARRKEDSSDGSDSGTSSGSYTSSSDSGTSSESYTSDSQSDSSSRSTGSSSYTESSDSGGSREHKKSRR